MYDDETKSLWSTLQGEPVVGPLVDKGIKLKRFYCVTSTWGQWKQTHPDTTVLSLNTGHDRNYDEGVAYREYFATDELMFSTSKSDGRLLNKDEVLALREGADQLAISVDFLLKNPVYHEKIGETDIVVLTDESGASRAYESGDTKFKSWSQDRKAFDEKGKEWNLTETSLSNPDGQELLRVSAHRAFWFGWHAQYENTRLVK